jgi:hypothetical protein
VDGDCAGLLPDWLPDGEALADELDPGDADPDGETDGDGESGALGETDGRTAGTVVRCTLGATTAMRAGLEGIVAPSAGKLTVPPADGRTDVVANTVGSTAVTGPVGPDNAGTHPTATAPAARIPPTLGSQMRRRRCRPGRPSGCVSVSSKTGVNGCVSVSVTGRPP